MSPITLQPPFIRYSADAGDEHAIQKESLHYTALHLDVQVEGVF